MNEDGLDVQTESDQVVRVVDDVADEPAAIAQDATQIVGADLTTEFVADVTTDDAVVDVTDHAHVAQTESAPDTLLGVDGPSIDAALEAILMVSDQPMNAVELATLLAVPTDEVETTLLELAKSYVAQKRGFELRIVDGGWRFFSAQHCADVVARFATEGRSAKLTQAALETLAVVAYKQPVSRARIGAIRGVNVDGVMRTLMTRGLVTEMETDPSTGAVLYGTTGFFLERMGLSSLVDLPAIEDHLPDLAVLDELIEPGN